MRKNVVSLLFVSALLLAAAVALSGATTTSAGKGGCPNPATANGAAHANANSALGPVKQEARGCLPGPVTTPTPTPTPTPTDEADVRVATVSVRAPDSATVGTEFAVRTSVSLRNDGPVASVLVDTTTDFVAPADCSVSPASPVTVEDTSLPIDVSVSVGRSWLVSCAQAGMHTFSADATVAIDPSQPVTDPDPSDNSGSGSDATDVVP